jgi:hypothetical protein
MKKNIHQMRLNRAKRFEEAETNYRKLLKEIDPFVQKLHTKEINTAGEWKNTSSFSNY